MSDGRTGILAMIGACTIWGASPIFYKLLAHIPALEVLAHRAIWSFVFFAAVLLVQGRLGEMREALLGPRNLVIFLLASLMISANWFLFIFAVQVGRTTESSLGYYIYPLLAVVIGRYVFAEVLSRVQWFAVTLAALAVAILTIGLGVAPWISLVLGLTFGAYGVIKKKLPLGPVLSVTCEILLFLPIALVVLAVGYANGRGLMGDSVQDAALLVLSGPLTGLPLILFSMAARRITMSTLGLLTYVNPTLQFICAVFVFGEPFSRWHAIAFALIWVALAIYSVSAFRGDRMRRRSAMAASGSGTTVR